MPELVRTTSENSDFAKLVRLLDADLARRDGEEHAFYAQFNKTAALQHVIVAYQHNVAVGCGALREIEPGIMEVKRMFVVPEHRGQGIAAAVLRELENWAAEMDYKQCRLETGKKQPEAVALYSKSGYERIPNYGQYLNVENSVCFQKILAERAII